MGVDDGQRLRDGAPGASEEEARTASLGRQGGAFGLMAHGLGHAVFAARAAGSVETAPLLRAVGHVGWVLALVGFGAAGLGLLGARPWRSEWPRIALASTLMSVASLLAFENPDLLPGLVFDAGIAIAIRNGAGEDWVAPVAGAPVSEYVRDALAALVLAYVVVAAVGRPWMQHWGTTHEEIARPLPSDPEDRDPRYEAQRAIIIDAPFATVAPVLARRGMRGATPLAVGDQTRVIVRTRSGDPRATAWGAAFRLAVREVPEFVRVRGELLALKAEAERRAPR